MCHKGFICSYQKNDIAHLFGGHSHPSKTTYHDALWVGWSYRYTKLLPNEIHSHHIILNVYIIYNYIHLYYFRRNKRFRMHVAQHELASEEAFVYKHVIFKKKVSVKQ